jgi:hypothetical protein
LPARRPERRAGVPIPASTGPVGSVRGERTTAGPVLHSLTEMATMQRPTVGLDRIELPLSAIHQRFPMPDLDERAGFGHAPHGSR